MEMVAMILADILFLSILAFTITIERRASKIEARSRVEVSRLSEKVWRLRHELGNMREALEEISDAETDAEALSRLREGEEERRFNEAVANILGYGLNNDSEAEDDK